MRFILCSALLFFLARPTFAARPQGLVIHATEMGVAKFHRKDNEVHPYEASNAWTPYILPAGAGIDKPIVSENADGSYTIFFSTLEDMLKKAVELSEKTGQKIEVLNLHGHGLPGGMWFPLNESFKNSFDCYQWLESAKGSDKGNYDQYYSPISKSDVMSIRQYSQTGGGVSCVVGLTQWRAILLDVPKFKPSLASNLKFNFLSCVVGLGPVGAKFTNGLGALLTNSEEAKFTSSLFFGLGDWSMAEGMGFWDYQNDAQIEKDMEAYPVDRKDRDIMQKGEIRISTLTDGKWDSKVVKDQEFMTLRNIDIESGVAANDTVDPNAVRPSQIRIVGTNVYMPVH